MRFFHDFFAVDGPTPLEERFAALVSHIQEMDRQIARLQSQVAGLEQAAHSKWNATDSGSLYKLFEQRKSWSEAERHCQSFEARLANIDSEAKNNYIKGLLRDKPTIDYLWIGMKTVSSQPSSQRTFSNFDKQNPINGCAVMNRSGVWSIRSCDQLHAFVCQMVVLRK
ncbi:lectin C-type domain protein [Ancylostoma caninum]|uniref:Lectin C-type domain protein n=1 Tax=Ancylostoma caninum TaxID=29170 RepID=A0A368F630_ANCCA|nr:lectin C-type domain protein [Ancylostoma caninum]